MLVIPGQPGKDLCDRHLGLTRRDLLRVGGSGLLGPDPRQHVPAPGQSGATSRGGGPGWGRAKSIIMVYLQGGPSHLDLWDPKDNVPDNVRSAFTTIDTRTRRRPLHRDPAALRPGDRQAHADPLDELHAERPLQPHRRHLPDDDRLDDRPRQPVRPARAARPSRLPELRLAAHPLEARSRCRCCRS